MPALHRVAHTASLIPRSRQTFPLIPVSVKHRQHRNSFSSSSSSSSQLNPVEPPLSHFSSVFNAPTPSSSTSPTSILPEHRESTWVFNTDPCDPPKRFAKALGKPLCKEEYQEVRSHLDRALKLLYPRMREAFNLIAFTSLSIEEICAKLRPENPLHPWTIVQHLLSAMDLAMDIDAEAALFNAVGVHRFYYIVQQDLLHWEKANGYHAYTTNKARTASICKHEIGRRKLWAQVKKGKVKMEDVPRLKQEILQGWKFADGHPKIPRKLLAHFEKTGFSLQNPNFGNIDPESPATTGQILDGEADKLPALFGYDLRIMKLAIDEATNSRRLKSTPSDLFNDSEDMDRLEEDEVD